MLAGSWTATGWPATLEGAVLSGHVAAREALATLAPSSADGFAPTAAQEGLQASSTGSGA